MKKIISLLLLIFLTNLMAKKFQKAKAMAKLPVKYNVHVKVVGDDTSSTFSFFAFVNLQDAYILFEKDGMRMNEVDRDGIVGTIIRCYKPNAHCFLPYFHINKCDMKIGDGNTIVMKTPYNDMGMTSATYLKTTFTFSFLKKEERAAADRILKEWKNSCHEIYDSYIKKRASLYEASVTSKEKTNKHRVLKREVSEGHIEHVQNFAEFKAKILKAAKKTGLKEGMDSVELETSSVRAALDFFKSHLYINGDMSIYNRLEEAYSNLENTN